MNKAEIQTFIEEMEEIGDIWTEEEAERCYGNISLVDALKKRKSEVQQHLTSIARAAIYVNSKEDK